MLVWMMIGSFLAGAPGDVQESAAKPKLAVMPFQGAGVEESASLAYTEKILVAVHRQGGYEEIGMSDLQTLLGMASFQQAVGCDDATCLAEIAGAAGVEYIIAGSLIREQHGYSAVAKLIDSRNARVIARAQQRNDSDEPPPAALLVGSLFGTEAAPVTFMDVLPWTAGAAGIAALGIGGAFGGLAQQSYKNARDPTRPGSQQAAQTTVQRQTTANVLFGVGGALLVGGVVSWLLTYDFGADEEGEP